MDEPLTVPNEEEQPQPASTPRTGKKRAPTRTSWQKGTSGNPAGRKPSRQTWAEVLKSVMDATAEELFAEVGGESTRLGRSIEDSPTGIPMKRLIAICIINALMHSPSAGLLNAILKAELPAVPDEESSPSEPSQSEDNTDEGS